MTQKKVSCLLLTLFVFLFWPQHLYLKNAQADKKEGYLLLLARSDVKSLYKDFIEERKFKYDFFVEILEENKVLNRPENIQKFLAKKWQEKNLKWIALDEAIKLPVNSYDVNKIHVEYSSLSMYWNLDNDTEFIPDVYVGIIRRFTLKPWDKLPSINGEFASTPDMYNRYTVGICCDTGVKEFSQQIDSVATSYKSKGHKVETLFETESTYQTLAKPTFSLNGNNFSDCYADSNLIWVNSTSERIRVWGSAWEYSFYDVPTRAVHIDQDGNGHVDNQNAEITKIETYFDPAKNRDNIKRITLLSGIEGVKNIAKFSDYVVIANSLKFSKIEFEQYFFEKLLAGETTAQIVGDGYVYFKDKVPKPFGKAWLQYDVLSWVVYGPPETVITDLVETTKIQFLPEYLNNEPVIEIVKGNIARFTIQNVGNNDVKIEMIFNENIIEINPLLFVLKAGEKREIEILIKKPAIEMFSTPKKKQTTITIKCGFIKKFLIVKWFSIK